MNTLEAKITIRRGLDAQRRLLVLSGGEIAYSTDIKRMFVGDGVTLGANHVGNKTFIAATTGVGDMPSNGIEFDSVYAVAQNSLFVLTGYNPTGSYGSDNISNYRRVTPLADNNTIIYDTVRGVFSINPYYFNNQDTGFVHLSGDVMKYGSYLTLGALPSANMHATPRIYVDTADNALSAKIDSLSAEVVALEENLNSGYVHLSGDTMKSTANGGVGINFNNTPITNFLAKVSAVSLTLANNNRTLSASDCGAVLYVSGQTASYIKIPRDLPIGYNVLVISNSDNNIVFRPVEDSGGVTILNNYGYRTISIKSGMCNLMVVATNVVVIAGDLS
jgi:hypothetical protein